MEHLGNSRQTAAERKAERCRHLAQSLRDGRKVTDFTFDQVFPPEIRKLSEVHWTPVEVAIRAAELLITDSRTRVLDVGSGSGKFCVVAALAVPGYFIGIEQRPQLAAVARASAEALGAEHASFIAGNFADLDWSFFDAFYLFNPFYENVMSSIRIDETVPHGQERFDRYVQLVRMKLRDCRKGTRVVTYHGFGGELPPGYRLEKKEGIGTSYLELWVRT